MIPRYRELINARRRLAIALASTTGLLLVLTLAPKDGSYAAPSRLIMTVIFGLTGIIGTYCVVRAWQRYAAARMALRYSGAPGAVLLTLRFMMDERRLGRRFILPAFLSALVALFLCLLGHWPQLGMSQGWRNTLLGAAIAALIGLAVAPLLHRTHWINDLHLRGLLGQQARHTRFTPVTARAARAKLRSLQGPAVVRAGDTVHAGGFAWSWSDLNKSCVVFGQPGSGKTSTVLNALLEWHFLQFRAPERFGGLVQDVMGDFKGKITRLCETYGRAGDLLIFDLQGDPKSAGSPHSAIFNPLHSADPPAEIAAALVACFEHIGLRASDTFFLDSTRIALGHAITLLRAATADGEAPSITDLHRLLTELHQAVENGTTDPRSEDFRPNYYTDLLDVIGEAYPEDTDLPITVLDAVRYMTHEFMPMPNRQRAGIIGGVTQLLAELMTEPVRHFTTGASTVSMQDVVDRGLLYYVHAPLAASPRLGLIINTLIKRQFQNAVLRRREKPIPSLYLCDEFHNLFSPGATGDSQFFSMSRQCNHANVIACQNIELLHQAAKAKAQVSSLISNAALKIFLRNTDPETNEMASRLLGEETGISVSQSEAADVSGLFRRTRTNYSRSTARSRVVPPEAFTRLAVPVAGDPDRQYAQSIVHLATRADGSQRLDLTWKVHPL